MGFSGNIIKVLSKFGDKVIECQIVWYAARVAVRIVTESQFRWFCRRVPSSEKCIANILVGVEVA